jgi:hypothetical protein
MLSNRTQLPLPDPHSQPHSRALGPVFSVWCSLLDSAPCLRSLNCLAWLFLTGRPCSTSSARSAVRQRPSSPTSTHGATYVPSVSTSGRPLERSQSSRLSAFFPIRAFSVVGPEYGVRRGTAVSTTAGVLHTASSIFRGRLHDPPSFIVDFRIRGGDRGPGPPAVRYYCPS